MTETIDLANGFSINNNSTKPDVAQKQEPQMKIQTKKAEANLVQKEIVKTYKGDTENVKTHQEFVLMLSRYGSSPIW